MIKKALFFVVLTCITHVSFGQIHEIGATIGASNFIGDVGRTNYWYPNALGGGLVYKYNLNPRIALTANYNHIKIKGDDSDAANPFRNERETVFSNTINELSLGTEISFFNFNINEPTTAYTPYIFAKIAMFEYQKPQALNGKILTTTSTYSYTAPLGVGFKGRIAENIAFAVETGLRLTFVDNIDFSTEKIEGLNFGGQGNDHYVFSGISITYTFGRPPCFASLEEE